MGNLFWWHIDTMLASVLLWTFSITKMFFAFSVPPACYIQESPAVLCLDQTESSR